MTARLLAIAASGWLLVALLAVTIRLPYRRRGGLRRDRQPPRHRHQDAAVRSDSEAPAARRWWPTALPRLAGLRLHYWLGYAIAALALAHGTASMTRGIAGRAHPAGLRLASLALLAALCEVAIGLTLRGRVQGRAAWRRLHLWVMVALVFLVAVHVALDSMLLGTFRGTWAPSLLSTRSGPGCAHPGYASSRW